MVGVEPLPECLLMTWATSASRLLHPSGQLLTLGRRKLSQADDDEDPDDPDEEEASPGTLQTP
ncbi:hypothetical protein C0Q70_16479 [Pomacea canaliculata]|uniref:Uncharacterized protein n=1 Tax=Pomacea canaliculata TaxID=400727 RepID=A0A2T7NPY9_POMCA|nr:hypothetical protein C0Q70_16479 [Pomacea canaliculata]